MSEIYSVNANNLAVSKYDDLDLIAFADYGGNLVSISSTKLYEHSGSDDDGTDIDCYIVTGQLFFGSNNDKRAAYVTARIVHSSKLAVSVVLPDLSSSEGSFLYYPCSEARQYSEGSSVNHSLDFRTPRGVRASTLGFKVSNVDGGTFGVRDLTIRFADTRLK